MKVHTHAYSGLYDPPAPVIEVGVRGPGQDSREVRVTALVNSGADATMLPIQVLRSVGARYVQTRYVRGVTGTRQVADTFLAVIKIGPHTIPIPEAVAVVRGEEAILGRDVLNQMVITLDGPALALEIGD